ncbi:hypothetical protein [Aequorivita capsosiphonis]|uniref:hypothetical protein n=1 Tax=Aequorivita capsosiphonis TaxID=487317 RepID=UPI0004286B86|nr:hypothetical protein [Aequorivita capsosiphonis]
MKRIMKNQFNKLLFLATFTISLLVVSCSSDDDGPGDDPSGLAPPIELSCDIFGEDVLLVDNPDAPVDYIISCYASVEKKLTIEPGVVVHFTEHAGLNFKPQSSIHAVGTPDKPIVMTGTELSPGWWKGIVVHSGSNTNIMEHVDISYGGSQIVNGDGPTSVVVYSGAGLIMKNSTIKHSEKSAFDARYRDSDVTLENNTFTENIQPLNISLQLAHKASATNDFSGNELDRVQIISNPSAIEENVVWQNINVPFRVTGNVGVSRLGSLTIEPGTIIEMEPGTRFDINEGGFKMVGTPDLPIVVRGVQSGPGSWLGIGLGTINPMNEIGFAKISDAGQDPENNKGAVILWTNTKLNIHDTEFKDLASCGVYGYLRVGQSENPNYSSSNLTFINTPCTELFERG